MKPYPDYRHNSIKWMGKIPEHWGMKSLKYFSRIVLGKMLTTRNKGDYCEKPYLRAKNILWECVDVSEVKEMWFSTNEMDQYRVKHNDLLVSEGGEVGRTAIWSSELPECYIQNSVHKVSMDSGNNSLYFLYQFELYGKIGHFDSIVNRVSIAHLTREKLKDVPFVVPPSLEQTVLANFLKQKTAKVDKLIQTKQKQIELLKEQRTAIINQAVTKGLDPDVEMKGSSIEWLGEIPKHWGRCKLKHIVSTKITDGPHETPKFVDAGIPFISAEAMKDSRIDFNFKRGYITEELHQLYCKKCKPERNDVFMVKSGATTGRIGIVEVDCEFSIWSPLALIRANQKVFLPRLLYYSVRSDGFQKGVQLSWSFGTQQNIGMAVIENLFVVVPPISEQQEIVVFLDAQSDKISNSISKAQKQIDLLTEYRTALISEAVTGKIDVRTWAK